jgi:hypothetical protein
MAHQRPTCGNFVISNWHATRMPHRRRFPNDFLTLTR